MSSPIPNQSGTYKLYGTKFSLFTGKLRAYLEKKGIPFKEVHSTQRTYKNFIVPRTGVSFIPVLQTPEDEVWQDTTEIIDRLEQRFPNDSAYPSTPAQRLVSLMLETYGDEWLVIPAMHYRWNFTEQNQPFIFEEFGTLASPWLPKFIRRRLGEKFGKGFSKFVPPLGIYEETIPAIEASYTKLLADLNTHFEQHDYLLGSRPSIGDYGLIGPFYAHLYRDPYPGELMRRTAPAVTRWVERMIDGKVAQGSFIDNDEIPQTLLPIIERIISEQLPVLVDTDKCLSKWRVENPDKRISRTVGKHEFTVEGVTGTRMTMLYSLWMHQRAVDYYQSLEADQRQNLEQVLPYSELHTALTNGLENSLARVDNRVQLDN